MGRYSEGPEGHVDSWVRYSEGTGGHVDYEVASGPKRR